MYIYKNLKLHKMQYIRTMHMSKTSFRHIDISSYLEFVVLKLLYFFLLLFVYSVYTIKPLFLNYIRLLTNKETISWLFFCSSFHLQFFPLQLFNRFSCDVQSYHWLLYSPSYKWCTTIIVLQCDSLFDV